jgi:transposase
MVSAAIRENDGVATMGQQSRYGAEFKQATIQELLAGEKRASQICRERRIDETTLRRWRLEYEEHGPAAWAPAAGVDGAAPADRVAELERIIGQLTVENLVLKKALQRARSLSARATPWSGS